MSYRIGRAHLAMGLSALLAVSGASAQAREPRVVFGVTGGFAKGPQEPFRSGTMGYNLAASMELRAPVRQIRLRTEAMFADWQANQVLALTGSIVLAPLSDRSVDPYLLAGAGAYKSPGENPLAGWNLGAGMKFDVGGRKVLVESRVHTFRIAEGVPVNLPSNTRLGRDWRTVWTPISLGFVF